MFKRVTTPSAEDLSSDSYRRVVDYLGGPFRGDMEAVARAFFVEKETMLDRSRVYGTITYRDGKAYGGFGSRADELAPWPFRSTLAAVNMSYRSAVQVRINEAVHNLRYSRRWLGAAQALMAAIDMVQSERLTRRVPGAPGPNDQHGRLEQYDDGTPYWTFEHRALQRDIHRVSQARQRALRRIGTDREQARDRRRVYDRGVHLTNLQNKKARRDNLGDLYQEEYQHLAEGILARELGEHRVRGAPDDAYGARMQQEAGQFEPWVDADGNTVPMKPINWNNI